MITTHDLRQPLESQPYALERHEQDLRQRLTVQSDTSSGKDQEKKRSPSKEGKVMKGLQILNRWWDLLFDERQGKQWATDKICRSLEDSRDTPENEHCFFRLAGSVGRKEHNLLSLFGNRENHRKAIAEIFRLLEILGTRPRRTKGGEESARWQGY
jgi:hypothetical protein